MMIKKYPVLKRITEKASNRLYQVGEFIELANDVASSLKERNVIGEAVAEPKKATANKE